VIFVDTGAWYAAFVPSDRNYQAADRWLDDNVAPLVTTDYVIDELLTLMKRRGEQERMRRLAEKLFTEEAARIAWVTEQDVREAWRVFDQHRDKAWSFTDCVSRAVMERLGITAVFAFDNHFRQFGTVSVVPD
jgi:uncharacterized protein